MPDPERKTPRLGRVCELVPDFTKEEIRGLRENLHMTRWEFSIQVGVPVNTITSWELGRRHPSHGARSLLRTLQEEGQQASTRESNAQAKNAMESV